MLQTTYQEKGTNRRVYRPSVQVFESPEAVELVAEVPGADESTTELTLENDELTLRARVPVPEQNGSRLVYAEYGTGDYERTFRLSSDIDRQKIEARVKDGVLRVRLPKAEHARTKKIAVLAG
uniref:Hsp20/alpha crystallin family protein n=1 Tax=Schlesneria paludicola TaxID=360056 RepID=A0A7C4LLV4_9PLAN